PGVERGVRVDHAIRPEGKIQDRDTASPAIAGTIHAGFGGGVLVHRPRGRGGVHAGHVAAVVADVRQGLTPAFPLGWGLGGYAEHARGGVHTGGWGVTRPVGVVSVEAAVELFMAVYIPQYVQYVRRPDRHIV